MNTTAFEQNAQSNLLEGRKQDGEYGMILSNEQIEKSVIISFYKTLFNYYKKRFFNLNTSIDRMALDSFEILTVELKNTKDNYIAQLKHNEALKKQCKAYQDSIDYRDEIITLQSDTIINLKETIAKNKGK